MLARFAPLVSRITPLSSPLLCPPHLTLQSRPFASQKHKRIVKMATGYKGRGKNVFSVAIERVEKALQHAYIGRKLKKRNMRTAWIESLNAGTRQYGVRYSAFINGLNNSGVQVRKCTTSISATRPSF